MDNTQAIEPVIEAPVASNVDAKVSDAEAQRKTAIMIEGLFAAMFFLVGMPVLTLGAVWLADPTSMGDAGSSALAINSYFSMVIVGAFLVIESMLSIIFTMEMQMKNKVDHKISNTLAGLTFITLNPASFNLVRNSNGWLSKKEKKKIAAKQAALESTDSAE